SLSSYLCSLVYTPAPTVLYTLSLHDALPIFGRDVHLLRARFAVRELLPADRDHGLAAPVLDRCLARAAHHGHDAQHLLDHRLHHADGSRDEERDLARRFHESRLASGQVAARGDLGGGASPVA